MFHSPATLATSKHATRKLVYETTTTPAKIQRSVVPTGMLQSSEARDYESPELAPSPKSPTPTRIFENRTVEARHWLKQAKRQLGLARNLKTEIRTQVASAIERLYQIVKESEHQSLSEGGGIVNLETAAPKMIGTEDDLLTKMAEHGELLKAATVQMGELREILIDQRSTATAPVVEGLGRQELLAEMQELKSTTQEIGRRVSDLRAEVPSYAEVLSKPKRRIANIKHSVIVSSGDTSHTSGDVVGRIRQALDAKKSGFKLDRVRKVKDQRVVLSCSSKEELERTAAQLRADGQLRVESARHRNPLVIVRDLLAYNTDEDIKAALKTQNARLLEGLSPEESAVVIKYRRRARNPLENHVILQVSPKMWERLTAAGRLYIDLQHVRVTDQSPLVQCSRCLSYGHGRKNCMESVDLCNHCGGPHMKADCPAHAEGKTVTCRNCHLAKHTKTDHSVFSGECPVRLKWDALARASVAYC